MSDNRMYPAMTESYYGKFPTSQGEDKMHSLEIRSHFTVRVSSPVVMDTRCAHASIWMATALVKEHTSRSSSLSCAVSMTRYCAGHSGRRSPSCCWIRIMWNTWSTPSDPIRAAPLSSDQEEKPTLQVDVPPSALYRSWTTTPMSEMTPCSWRLLLTPQICKAITIS